MACSDTLLLAFQTHCNESDPNSKTNGHIFTGSLGEKTFFFICLLGFAREVVDKTGTFYFCVEK